MRVAIALSFALAAATSRADTTTVKLGSPGALAKWKRVASNGTFEIKGQELVVSGAGTWSQSVALDANRGWVIEARFAAELDAPAGGTTVTGSDGRQLAWFARRVGNTITLDGQDTTIVDDDQPHTYRLEVMGGHHRLLIDGKLVVEADRAITAFDSDPEPPHVSFGSEDGSTAPTVHWITLVIDTSPRGLVKSAFSVSPLARFAGPFKTWLWQLANDAPELALDLSRVTLTEDARACVAFAIVRAAGAALPARFRRTDFNPPNARALSHGVGTGGVEDRTRLPICDPAGPCDCGRCPQPESYEDRAKGALHASLNAATDADARSALDDAVSWVLAAGPTSNGSGPAAPPNVSMKPNEQAQPTPVSFSSQSIRDLVVELRKLSKHPRACR